MKEGPIDGSNQRLCNEGTRVTMYHTRLKALIPCGKETVFLNDFIDVNNRIYTRNFLRILIYFRTRLPILYLELDYINLNIQ